MTITKKSIEELSISEDRLTELAARSDDTIDYSDIPKLDADFWETATPKHPSNKERLTVRFDARYSAMV